MTDFQVDTAALDHLAAALQRVSAQLDGMDSTVRADDAAFGSAEAAGALDTFVSEWSQGVAKIKDDVATVSKYLKGAADAYSSNEQQLTDAARGRSGG